MGKNRVLAKSYHKSAPRRRYKNASFLKQLGDHCRSLRLKMNYSIDRLSKESDQLSPASVDRLERGLGDSQILVLLRYAETLGLSLLDLFSFLKENSDPLKENRIMPFEKDIKQPVQSVPVFTDRTLQKALLKSEKSVAPNPIGWIDAGSKFTGSDYFVVFTTNESMLPTIPKNSMGLFKKYTGELRLGRVFLTFNSLTEPESGDPFLIRKFKKLLINGQQCLQLIPENPKFETLTLCGTNEFENQFFAEFLRVL